MLCGKSRSRCIDVVNCLQTVKSATTRTCRWRRLVLALTLVTMVGSAAAEGVPKCGTATAPTAARSLSLGELAARDTQVSELITRADVLDNYGDLGEALAAEDAALRLDPDNVPMLQRRGQTLHSMGRFEHALRDFDRTMQIEDRNEKNRCQTALWGRGRALIGLKDYQAAIVSLDEAFRLNRRAAAYASRAEAYLGLGKLQEAMADVDREIWLSNESVHAYLVRARILTAWGRDLEAAQDRVRADYLASFGQTNYLFGRLQIQKFIETSTVSRSIIGVPRDGRYTDWNLYPETEPHCTDGARHVLSISMASGQVLIRPAYAGPDGIISIAKLSGGLSATLGNQGCRVTITIAKPDTKNPDAAAEAQRVEVQVQRDAQDVKFEQIYSPPQDGCFAGVAQLRAYWGFVEMKWQDARNPDARRVDRARDAPVVLGEPPCELHVTATRAD